MFPNDKIKRNYSFMRTLWAERQLQGEGKLCTLADKGQSLRLVCSDVSDHFCLVHWPEKSNNIAPLQDFNVGIPWPRLVNPMSTAFFQFDTC